MPQQARNDVAVEVNAAVARIKSAKVGELQGTVRTVTKDLMSKLPKADIVYLEQMMLATFCSAIRDDKSLSETEKAKRIEAYNREVRKTFVRPQQSAPPKGNRQKQVMPPKQEMSQEITPQIGPGTILATHYPTGELFAIDPLSSRLSLVSARLGEPSGIAVKSTGEIVVVDAKHGTVQGVEATTGRHTFTFTGEGLWNQRPIAIALESDRSAVVATSHRIIRVNLITGAQQLLSHGNLLAKISGITVDISGLILVTDLSGKIIEVDPETGSQRLLSEKGKLHHPRAPIIESGESMFVGTAGDSASVIRVQRSNGAQTVVATGPFSTIAGMALEKGKSIIVADNGRGAPGDGFIARVDLQSGQITKLVFAQTSKWRFLNGRAVAVIPGR
jgi:DNA-binding beta-propeller fold protein YncE